MKKLAVLINIVLLLVMITACNPAASKQVPTTSQEPPLQLPENLTSAENMTSSGTVLTLNPVEESKPIYGGTLERGYYLPRTFDAHQNAGYAPNATLPVFNQLVMFDINYKETVPETIIGDLAETWETSADGKDITFNLRKGVKWHDGVPFTANDVVYSLNKMADVNRSVISNWFPAYENTEKIDEYTVKVHLKYPSASFMLMLAQGESQIQSYHLSSVDPQSAAFMVGTGPFILTEYLSGVHLKYKRNPDYWKKDKYGNQLPYLDGVNYYHTLWQPGMQMLIAKRVDMVDFVQGANTSDDYEALKSGAPELLWQRRDKFIGQTFAINLKHKPLDDVRVRRAMGLVLQEEDIITGFAGDPKFGISGSGILHPNWGLPKEEVASLMGWDKPYDERVAEAQRLMAEAGYPDGFELNMMATGPGGGTLVFADELHQNLKIDAKVTANLGTNELQTRIKNDDYDIYLYSFPMTTPVQLNDYFVTGGYINYSNYSNNEVDRLASDIDYIIDPDKSRETIWSIERILLTELPVLPTGRFNPSFMPYYPWVKNIRFNYISYSNINRMEDIWLDESLRVK